MGDDGHPKCLGVALECQHGWVCGLIVFQSRQSTSFEPAARLDIRQREPQLLSPGFQYCDRVSRIPSHRLPCMLAHPPLGNDCILFRLNFLARIVKAFLLSGIQFAPHTLAGWFAIHRRATFGGAWKELL